MAYNESHVKKDRTAVIIQTAGEKIEGMVQKLPSTRLLDMLNKNPEMFLPVADAKIYDLASGRLIFESSFLAVNKSQIVIILESYTIPEV